MASHSVGATPRPAVGRWYTRRLMSRIEWATSIRMYALRRRVSSDTLSNRHKAVADQFPTVCITAGARTRCLGSGLLATTQSSVGQRHVATNRPAGEFLGVEFVPDHKYAIHEDIPHPHTGPVR